jgi:UDP-N-acetylmuramate--alanine ligase
MKGMHIYFSGIGGVGLGPLAEIALDAGYDVSGSDSNDSPMYQTLTRKGAKTHLGQEEETIAMLHKERPIDWIVYTAALPADHPELMFAKSHGIKTSKRDELLAQIITEKNLALIAVAGTHGKTTTTAMLVWALRHFNIPASYSIGSQISFGASGHYDPASRFFIYECDEFDRNFLHFSPSAALITNIDYDHPDTYPTKEEYLSAFDSFIKQSGLCITWQEYIDTDSLAESAVQLHVIDRSSDAVRANIGRLPLVGRHNRENGHLVKTLLEDYFSLTPEAIVDALKDFPGTSRRFEKLSDNLYSDYAHHPTEIRATLQLARELNERVVAVYQPHQNARQHDIRGLYRDCFAGAEKVYWLPTYLSREPASLSILSPEELASNVHNTPVEVVDTNELLWQEINTARQSGALVLCMGAGSIDPWIRRQLTSYED